VRLRQVHRGLGDGLPDFRARVRGVGDDRLRERDEHDSLMAALAAEAAEEGG
jgi:hypothetical protein